MQDQSPTSAFPDLKNLKGMSYYDILLFLYKAFAGVNNIPNDNPVLNSCALLDAKSAQLKVNITELPKLSQKCDAIRIIIEKLKAPTAQPATKQLGETYARQLFTLEEKIRSKQAIAPSLDDKNKPYETVVNEILAAFDNMMNAQHKEVLSLLTQIASADDINRVSNSPEIKAKIAKQITDFTNLQVRVAKLTEETKRSTLPQLDDIHKQAFRSLPIAEQKTVMAPSAEEAPRGATPG